MSSVKMKILGKKTGKKKMYFLNIFKNRMDLNINFLFTNTRFMQVLKGTKSKNVTNYLIKEKNRITSFII